MKKRKQEKKTRRDHTETYGHVICDMCGSAVKPDASSWQEDDGMIFCPDCLAEKNSCGCSD